MSEHARFQVSKLGPVVNNAAAHLHDFNVLTLFLKIVADRKLAFL